MNKFTPGPWLREGTTVYALMHSGWKKGVEQFKNRFYCSVQHDKDCSKEEAEATATLMAAAPDLFESLETIVNSLVDADEEGLIEHTDQINKARAAIAKARGES